MLIAPLDWGLGHTTRCIPLISYLLQKNCQITIAGTEQQFAILKPEFPDAEYILLPGYGIEYPLNYKRFKRKLLYQIPGLLKRISNERKWLGHHYNSYRWDALISDNRFGLVHPRIYSVFITHQLHIFSGLGRAADSLLQRMNYHYIRKFNECWIPDLQREPSMAGLLSHPQLLPGNEKYLGPLSRFDIKESNEKSDLLVLISGPEPQRTVFENLVLQQLAKFTGKVFLVRGRPLDIAVPEVNTNVTVLNNPGSLQLEKFMNGAATILCRSGYTTIMDLIRLQKKAILVPTPGQTEQEYLATHLHDAGLFFTVEQAQLNIESDFKAVNKFQKNNFPAYNFGLYKEVIDDLLFTISSKNK
ncbi:glycosyltransferase [Pollutibacter soli]|uniref:glycosyltransferase n=1 Tax=Pollutibacter soli TaxID=3034157 RepID=UPI0030137B53